MFLETFIMKLQNANSITKLDAIKQRDKCKCLHWYYDATREASKDWFIKGSEYGRSFVNGIETLFYFQ